MKKRAFVAWLWSLACALAAQEPTVMRSHDLGEVVPYLDRRAWTMPLAAPPAPEADGLLERGADAAAEPAETLVEILTQLLGDELRQQGRTFEYDGAGRLVVVAPAAVQQRIQQALDGLRATFQAELELQVDVLTLRGGEPLPPPPTNVLATDAAARLQAELVGRGAVLETHTLRLQAGRTSSVRIQRQHPFVFDHEVEIAQGAWIFDPDVRTAEEGTRILMRGVGLPGGVLLTSVLRLAQLEGEIETVDLLVGGTITSESEGVATIAGPDKVQTARMALQAVAFQSFLPEGKVLLVALHSSSGGAALQQVVLLRKQGGALPSLVSLPSGNSARVLLLVNGERIRPPTLTLLSDDFSAFLPSEHPVLAATSSSELPLALRDWVKGHFAVWRAVGPWAVVVSDPAWDADAGAAQALLDEVPAATTVRDLSVLVRADGERPLLGFSLPLLEGTSAGVMVGSTTTELVDYDVEVAQLAAVADPVHRSLFEGLSVVARASRGAGARSLVTLLGSARTQERPSSTLSMGGSLTGSLTLPVRRSIVLDERLQLGDDQGQPARASLGSGSDLVVEIQLR